MAPKLLVSTPSISFLSPAWFCEEFAKCGNDGKRVPGQSVVRLTLVLKSRRDDAGTDGSTLEKSEVRALMRSIA